MTAEMGLVLDCADPATLAEFWAPADPEGNEFCVCDSGTSTG